MGIYQVEKLPEYIRRALSGINHQMSREDVCGTERDAVQRLRAYALDIDGVEDLAVKDISLRGLIEYGAVLRRGMVDGFRTPNDYRQMLANWQAFLKAHPDCDSAYMTAYQAFLKDMKKHENRVRKQKIKGNVLYRKLRKAKQLLAKLFNKKRM